MGHDIRSPLKRPAVDGSRKSIVHNQRNAVGMGASGKLLNVKHSQSRIGYGFAEHRFCIVPEGRIQLLFGRVRADKRDIDAHLFHSNGNQVESAAVYGTGRHNVVAAAADVKQCIEISGLSAAGQHPSRTALQPGDFRRHIVIGGILEPGIEITACLQVEELSHILTGVVFERSALNDGNLTGLPVSRRVAALYTYTADLHIVFLLI